MKEMGDEESSWARGAAISAQGKYTLTVPGGLAFSEFWGFEDWQTCRRQSVW